MTNTSMTQAERDRLKQEQGGRVGVWLFLEAAAPGGLWTLTMMTYREAEEHVADPLNSPWRVGGDVALVHLLARDGQSHLVIGDAEDLVGFRQFLKGNVSSRL